MWRQYNPNPLAVRVGDCAVRAVAKACCESWEEAYMGLALTGYLMGDMPSANNVWGAYLRKHGFKRYALPDQCPDCYTVKEFCHDNPDGIYVLALNGHVVTACGGDYFDTWDSGTESPSFYWAKED